MINNKLMAGQVKANQHRQGWVPLVAQSFLRVLTPQSPWQAHLIATVGHWWPSVQGVHAPEPEPKAKKPGLLHIARGEAGTGWGGVGWGGGGAQHWRGCWQSCCAIQRAAGSQTVCVVLYSHSSKLTRDCMHRCQRASCSRERMSCMWMLGIRKRCQQGKSADRHTHTGQQSINATVHEQPVALQHSWRSRRPSFS